jgi:hypothetical protein
MLSHAGGIGEEASRLPVRDPTCCIVLAERVHVPESSARGLRFFNYQNGEAHFGRLAVKCNGCAGRAICFAHASKEAKELDGGLVQGVD